METIESQRGHEQGLYLASVRQPEATKAKCISVKN